MSKIFTLNTCLLLGLYLLSRGEILSTTWLMLNLLDSYKSLSQTRPNGRRIGSATRRKAMRDALISWIVYLVIRQTQHIPDWLLGWIPVYGPIRAIMTLAFLFTRSSSSHSIYHSVLVTVLRRYETPIDLTILLFHSVFVLISHYTLLLPISGVQVCLHWLSDWAKGTSSGSGDLRGNVNINDRRRSSVKEEQKQDRRGSPSPDTAPAEMEDDPILHQSRRTPRRKTMRTTTSLAAVDVQHPTPTTAIDMTSSDTPKLRSNSLRPPSPPMTLRRSPRRPSPHMQSPPSLPTSHPKLITSSDAILFLNNAEAGPSRLPATVLPTKSSHSCPTPRETDILRLKPNSTLPKHKTTAKTSSASSLTQRQIGTTTLGGSLALYNPPKRITLHPPPFEPTTTKRLVYPKLPDLPSNLVVMPIHSTPPVLPAVPAAKLPRVIKQARPVRETIASKARASRVKKPAEDDKVVVGSKRKATVAVKDREDKRIKRAKP